MKATAENRNMTRRQMRANERRLAKAEREAEAEDEAEE